MVVLDRDTVTHEVLTSCKPSFPVPFGRPGGAVAQQHVVLRPISQYQWNLYFSAISGIVHSLWK